MSNKRFVSYKGLFVEIAPDVILTNRAVRLPENTPNTIKFDDVIDALSYLNKFKSLSVNEKRAILSLFIYNETKNFHVDEMLIKYGNDFSVAEKKLIVQIIGEDIVNSIFHPYEKNDASIKREETVNLIINAYPRKVAQTCIEIIKKLDDRIDNQVTPFLAYPLYVSLKKDLFSYDEIEFIFKWFYQNKNELLSNYSYTFRMILNEILMRMDIDVDDIHHPKYNEWESLINKDVIWHYLKYGKEHYPCSSNWPMQIFPMLFLYSRNDMRENMTPLKNSREYTDFALYVLKELAQHQTNLNSIAYIKSFYDYLKNHSGIGFNFFNRQIIKDLVSAMTVEKTNDYRQIVKETFAGERCFDAYFKRNG